MGEQKQVILLRRVSTDKQCTDLQDEALKAYQKTLDRGVVWLKDTYTGKTLSRKGIRKARKLIRAGQVDELVVWRLDRLGRNLLECGRFLRFCERHHVKVKSLTENLDFSTAAGRLVVFVLLSFAQYERELISERTKAGMACIDRTTTRVGGSPKGKKWISQKIKKKLPLLLSLFKSGHTNYQIEKLTGISRSRLRDLRSRKPEELLTREEVEAKLKKTK